MSQAYGPFLTAGGGGYTVRLDYARLTLGPNGGVDGPVISTLAKLTVLDEAGRSVTRDPSRSAQPQAGSSLRR